MKREIFFWLERLKIAPTERKVVSGLLVLLVLLGTLNLALSPSIPFEDEDYLELERQFQERAVMLEAEEENLMKQYYPSENEEVFVVSTDTVTEDSTADKEEHKPDQKAEKERININSADEKTLTSLPGIGTAYAKRIIKYRNENGEFESIDELKEIKGIAQKRLEKLKPFIKLKDSNQ